MDVDAEVERRLTELRDRPELLSRWDLNRDGELDEHEWELVRRMVDHEVRTAWERDSLWSPDFEPIVLNDRYEVVGLLGRGGQAKTYLAIDREHDRHVVAKVLELQVASDWKSIELFEREAAILERLDHPRIPSYIDHFHHAASDAVEFVVIQEFVDGEDLGEFLDGQKRWTAEDARLRLTQLAAVLEYLHGLAPPVVHRDIKPSNLILGRDGELYLVDFGAAQNIVPLTVGGSTVIGTSGYVPMEQYMGRAVPASDLYALGATTLHMLSGVHPADHEFERGRLVTANHVGDRRLRKLLDEMLAPHVEDRLRSAKGLLTRLRSKVEPSRALVVAPSTELSEIEVYARRLVASGAEGKVSWTDPMRPWLTVSRQNVGNQMTRTIGHVRIATMGAFRSQLVWDPHTRVRAGIFLGTVIVVFATMVFTAWLWLPLLVMSPVSLFYGRKQARLNAYGWTDPQVHLSLAELGHFVVEHDVLAVFDKAGVQRSRHELPELSNGAAEYLELVLNAQHASLRGEDAPDLTQPW